MKKLKKLALVAIIAVMASQGTNAQLIISTNGTAHFGDTAVVDTTVTVHIAGTGTNGSRGKLAFGNKHLNITSVFLGEYATTGSNSDTDRLWLHGRNGLVYTLNNDKYVAMRHSPHSLEGFNFRAPISVRSAYIAADPRLNAETQSISSALGILQGLNAIRYRLNLPIPAEEGFTDINLNLGGPVGTNGYDGSSTPKPSNLAADSLHYGLTLESLQSVLPHLVIEDSDGIKYADYNSLIPLLVLAVNELNVKVTQLTARLDALEEHAGDGEEVPSEEGLRSDSGDVDPDGIDSLFNPALYQNIPNPFSADTHIRYCLPESVVQADLYIYDMQGHQIKRIRVEGRGESTVTIHGSELQAGMYIYALIADGQEIDSKRMILTK